MIKFQLENLLFLPEDCFIISCDLGMPNFTPFNSYVNNFFDLEVLLPLLVFSLYL